MILPIIPILYSAMDYLMDQKERIEELEKKLERTANENRKALIKAQIEIYYEQGLEALARFENDTPKSVRDYFLGYRKTKPDFNEISMEMAREHPDMKKLDSKIVYISISIALGILTILYFFGL